MEQQGVPGSQNEPFFDLLHPTVLYNTTNNSTSNNHSSASASASVSEPPQSAAADLAALPEENYGDGIVPSYDFVPIRNHSLPTGRTGDGGGRSAEDLPYPPKASYPSPAADQHYQPHDLSYPPKASYPSPATDQHYQAPESVTMKHTHTLRSTEKSKDGPESFDSVTLSAVEKTMKKYADNLLQVLEGMSGRLSQLETTVHGLEHCVEGLRMDGGENHSQTNGRLTRLEILLKEVQEGVQLLHEKQHVAEVTSQLGKLHVASNGLHVSGAVLPTADDWKQPIDEGQRHILASQPPHPPPQHSQAVSASQLPSHHPQPQSQPQVLAPPQQPLPQQQPLLQQQSLPQQPSLPQQVAAPEPVNPTNQPPPPPASQHQVATPPNLAHAPPHSMKIPSFYSQPPTQPPSTYNQPSQTASYGAPQSHFSLPPAPPASTSYIPEIPQYYEGPRQHSVAPQALPTAQDHAPNVAQQIYEPSSGRVGSAPYPLYLHQQPQSSPVSNVYEAPSGGYGSAYRVAQPIPSAPSGGSGYSRLPTAQPLPHALPTSGGGSSETSSSTNRISLDEVIERVVTMGFPREQVRAVVRHLTENRQSVDLNVVLDKLTNGGEIQPPRGWFARG